ncbi:hypothetical protein E8E12_003495 [Didymella heteroderae]|uniref:Uncharacterized protein n=1 Tax=Didymella heteroderae TaxID=1769908 RepID=A0A9P5BX70_9PLEO|nr:hypothetical protein E8E12_003495 [Didymella heteroderae]
MDLEAAATAASDVPVAVDCPTRTTLIYSSHSSKRVRLGLSKINDKGQWRDKDVTEKTHAYSQAEGGVKINQSLFPLDESTLPLELANKPSGTWRAYGKQLWVQRFGLLNPTPEEEADHRIADALSKDDIVLTIFYDLDDNKSSPKKSPHEWTDDEVFKCFKDAVVHFPKSLWERMGRIHQAKEKLDIPPPVDLQWEMRDWAYVNRNVATDQYLKASMEGKPLPIQPKRKEDFDPEEHERALVIVRNIRLCRRVCAARAGDRYYLNV